MEPIALYGLIFVSVVVLWWAFRNWLTWKKHRKYGQTSLGLITWCFRHTRFVKSHDLIHPNVHKSEMVAYETPPKTKRDPPPEPAIIEDGSKVRADTPSGTAPSDPTNKGAGRILDRFEVDTDPHQ